MNIEQLEQVVSLVNKHSIVQELKKIAYHDAGMDKKYKDFPIPSILKGSEQETELREDVNGKYEYKGSVYMNVEGAEFIAISVNKIDKAKDMSEIRY